MVKLQYYVLVLHLMIKLLKELKEITQLCMTNNLIDMQNKELDLKNN